MKIRHTHPYGHRAGEWAIVRGIVEMSPTGGPDDVWLPPRNAYWVEFEDGITDFWVCDDSDGRYEYLL